MMLFMPLRGAKRRGNLNIKVPQSLQYATTRTSGLPCCAHNDIFASCFNKAIQPNTVSHTIHVLSYAKREILHLYV